MNKRRLFKAAACAAAFAPLFFASCVDDSYDLSKDIDMTVTIGGNLSIPGSGTEEFSLDDIMDLEYKENPEDSVIRTDADGNYRLLKEESSDPTDVDIEPVIIDEPECEETITTLNFDTPAAVSGEVEAQVEDVEMNFTFTKDDVTTDVTEVSAADVDFKAYLTLSFDPISHNVDEITLKSGFTIEMQMEGQTQADNMVYELTDLDNYRVKDARRRPSSSSTTRPSAPERPSACRCASSAYRTSPTGRDSMPSATSACAPTSSRTERPPRPT